eukprot:1676865-Pleurochrysis_carterae.AAC.1
MSSLSCPNDCEAELIRPAFAAARHPFPPASSRLPSLVVFASQHPEKFIPLCINKILNGEKITIHSYKGSTRAGALRAAT